MTGSPLKEEGKYWIMLRGRRGRTRSSCTGGTKTGTHISVSERAQSLWKRGGWTPTHPTLAMLTGGAIKNPPTGTAQCASTGTTPTGNKEETPTPILLPSTTITKTGGGGASKMSLGEMIGEATGIMESGFLLILRILFKKDWEKKSKKCEEKWLKAKWI